jgi:hypothetical protein
MNTEVTKSIDNQLIKNSEWVNSNLLVADSYNKIATAASRVGAGGRSGGMIAGGRGSAFGGRPEGMGGETVYGEGTPDSPYHLDFISRPGSGIARFSPDDTIIGVKNPGALGGNYNITFSPTITVNAGSNVDIDRLKSQLSSEWRNELDRIVRR